MTVYELKQILEDFDEDKQIRVAFQPSWPLRAHIQSVGEIDREGMEDEEDPAQDDVEEFVWIAVEQVSSSSENPYAPREAWQ